MATAKIRRNNAWVDSTKSGYARVGGAWVAFGPSAPTYEALNWNTTPTNTNAADGTQSYNMGVMFHVLVAKNCVGIRWRVPDSVVAPAGGSHIISLWTEAGVKQAEKTFTPTVGVNQDILFTTPIALSTTVNYIAAVYTNHYVFRSATPAGITSPSGNVIANSGRLVPYNGGAATFPDGTFTSIYYISPLVIV